MSTKRGPDPRLPRLRTAAAATTTTTSSTNTTNRRHGAAVTQHSQHQQPALGLVAAALASAAAQMRIAPSHAAALPTPSPDVETKTRAAARTGDKAEKATRTPKVTARSSTATRKKTKAVGAVDQPERTQAIERRKRHSSAAKDHGVGQKRRKKVATNEKRVRATRANKRRRRSSRSEPEVDQEEDEEEKKHSGQRNGTRPARGNNKAKHTVRAGRRGPNEGRDKVTQKQQADVAAALSRQYAPVQDMPWHQQLDKNGLASGLAGHAAVTAAKRSKSQPRTRATKSSQVSLTPADIESLRTGYTPIVRVSHFREEYRACVSRMRAKLAQCGMSVDRAPPPSTTRAAASATGTAPATSTHVDAKTDGGDHDGSPISCAVSTIGSIGQVDISLQECDILTPFQAIERAIEDEIAGGRVPKKISLGAMQEMGYELPDVRAVRQRSRLLKEQREAAAIEAKEVVASKRRAPKRQRVVPPDVDERAKKPRRLTRKSKARAAAVSAAAASSGVEATRASQTLCGREDEHKQGRRVTVKVNGSEDVAQPRADATIPVAASVPKQVALMAALKPLLDDRHATFDAIYGKVGTNKQRCVPRREFSCLSRETRVYTINRKLDAAAAELGFVPETSLNEDGGNLVANGGRQRDRSNDCASAASHRHIRDLLPALPDGEVLLEIAFYHPDRFDHQQSFLVAASTPLTSLRDAVYCPLDCASGGSVASSMPSGSFFIESTLYDDMRDKRAVALSEPIVQWMHEQQRYLTPGLSPLRSLRMEQATFADLNVRQGSHYFYVHHGDCRHLFIVTSVRSLRATEDERAFAAYPIKVFQAKARRKKCDVCDVYAASFVTYGDRLTTRTPFFFCKECYRPFHYSADGRLLYSDFRVFPYSTD